MTEKKKIYIMDALSEVEDKFITEAIEYKKPKFLQKYSREIYAVAACAAVLLISVSAINLLPIGDFKKGTGMNNSASAEMAPDLLVGAPESVEGKYEIIWEEKETEDGITMNKENSGEDSSTTTEAVQSESKAEWITLEQLLEKGVDVFMGTVTEINRIEVSGEQAGYLTVATITVEESIRGELQSGDQCRICISSLKADYSVKGDAAELKKGSRAIFLPYKNAASDYAEYDLGTGHPILFVEIPKGILYKENIYTGTDNTEPILEKAAAYIRDLLEE